MKDAAICLHTIGWKQVTKLLCRCGGRFIANCECPQVDRWPT